MGQSATSAWIASTTGWSPVRRRLRLYSQSRLDGCDNAVLTGDGGMKLTTSLCNERSSGFRENKALQMRLCTGCCKRPRPGSLFCSAHQVPPEHAAGPLPLGPEVHSHRLRGGTVEFRLLGGGRNDWVAPAEIHSARVSQYDSRRLLARETAPDAEPLGEEDFANSSHEFRMTASDRLPGGCRCVKDDRKALAVRKYAGVFCVVLPCGHVVHVSHMVGSESLPQVAYAFAETLQLLPRKTYLIYDFACGLARFLRNPVRAEATPTRRKLASCTFVAPDSHIRNHTACVDETNETYFLPEVRKSAHPELKGINCEAQEQAFSWVKWLTHVANPMTPAKHRAFFRLLVLCRNGRARVRPCTARVRRVIVLQVQIFIFHRKFSNLHDEKISAFSPGQALQELGKNFSCGHTCYGIIL